MKKLTLAASPFVLLLLLLFATRCTTKQFITKKLSGTTWVLFSQTDTLGRNVPLNGLNVVYTFDNCSGSASSCNGNVATWSGTGPAPKGTSFTWGMEGSYLTMVLSGVTIKFNVIHVTNTMLDLQYLYYPAEHYVFTKK